MHETNTQKNLGAMMLMFVFQVSYESEGIFICMWQVYEVYNTDLIWSQLTHIYSPF